MIICIRFRYHCLYMEDDDTQTEDDVQFERTAQEFQGQFNSMVNKYQYLLMKESMVSLVFLINFLS